MTFSIVLSVTFIGRDHVFAEGSQYLFTPVIFQMIYRNEYGTYQVLYKAYGLQTFS